MTTIKFKNGDNWENMALSCYPVGSVYMSENSTSPATIFGGTWVALENRMLIGASGTYSAGSTGGSATTTLATTNLPAHAHTVPAHNHGLNGHTHSYSAPANHTHGLSNGYALISSSQAWTEFQYKNVSSWKANWHVRPKPSWDDAASSTSLSTATGLAGSSNSGGGSSSATTGGNSGNTADKAAFNTNNTGSGTAFDTISPYYAVYMWKRTA